jgi:hypothetical protein
MHMSLASRIRIAFVFVTASAGLVGAARAARAQEPPPSASPPAEASPPVEASPPAAAGEVAPPPHEAPPPHSPYSLPFQLRPVTASTVVRSDTSFAKYENVNAKGGFAVVSELLGAFRIPGTGEAPGTGLAPLVKFTVVNDSPPAGATGGFAFVNPLVGAAYALSLGDGFRASAFLGFTIPIGMGGGNTPDKGALDARNVGPAVRAGLDNSLFAVNDFAVIPGVDVGYVAHGFTAQAEATLFQLNRVRGSAADPDSSKTNLTGGLHVGYFVLDVLSIGAELRYQRWLAAPSAVQTNKPGTSVDLLSMGVGPRFHFELSPGVWIRPGLAYIRGFDPPMNHPANDNIVQLDVPVVF